MVVRLPLVEGNFEGEYGGIGRYTGLRMRVEAE